VRIKALSGLRGWSQAFCLGASFILLFISSLSFAQDETDASEAYEELLEEVVVTGSRIKRRDFSSTSPITTITAEQFEFSGQPTLEEYLNQMPQLHPDYGRTSNNPGNGTAQLNLRGLGAGRTLVLLNGRRVAPSGVGSAVDVNNLPRSLIERVEIITGGASTVYGSDAIAGVINFITRQDFDGYGFDASYYVTAEGDSDIYDANFVYAMEAFSLGAESWKEHLLSGDLSPVFARRVGVALGLTIRNSWRSAELKERFGDRTAFDQLRDDPYYGEIARRHPSIAGAVDDWRDRDVPTALVHGDWSPKNILVDGERLIFIDYECAHFGDPTFDSAFILNHLLLKGVHRPALRNDFVRLARLAHTWTLSVLPPEALATFEADTMRHLSFLMLARIDGKSPVEYLADEAVRERVRQTALRLIARCPCTLEAALALL